MGHRRHSQPRRGSLAYLPRGRARSMEARIRMNGWPQGDGKGEPRLAAHCGFKAGCIQLVTIDDREHVPNHGKQLVVLGTVLATPPVVVVGVRGYSKGVDGVHAEFDLFADDIPKHIAKEVSLKNKDGAAERARQLLPRIDMVFAVVAVSPRAAGLEQKKPYVFESPVEGGDVEKQFEFASDLLGKEVRFDQVFEAGSGVDVAAITKGKGWQGVIQRYGAKKKQHKSRKTVRELGSLGPISPQNIMYTVPRAGQMGFHQRIEYNKRVMVVGSAGGGGNSGGGGAKSKDDAKGEARINPDGGYKHFGLVRGDYVVLKGSVPGTYRRLVKMRGQIRNRPAKSSKPNVLEMVV